MPPATVTSWPVTWPESTSEASTTTCAATSSGWRDLLQRHRPRHAAQRLLVERAARHRRLRPAGADSVHARARRDPHDLVLQAEQEPVGDRRLRRGVVGVAGLAEEARGRARRAPGSRGPAPPLRAGTRAPSGRSRSGSRAASPPSARAAAPRPARPRPARCPATAAHTSSGPASSNSRSTSASTRRSAPDDRRGPERLGSLAPAVVVRDDLAALRHEQPRARRSRSRRTRR